LKATTVMPRLLLLVSVLLLAGCASYDAHLVRKKGFTGVKRFFVLTNLNDNHALDHRIAEALQAHGYTVETGPRTMMPEDTQAIVSYQDRWSWDFGDHLVYLTIGAEDALTNEPIAVVSFSVSIPLREPVPTTIGRLVNDLLTGRKS
jgi:hypothetical protein